MCISNFKDPKHPPPGAKLSYWAGRQAVLLVPFVETTGEEQPVLGTQRSRCTVQTREPTGHSA